MKDPLGVSPSKGNQGTTRRPAVGRSESEFAFSLLPCHFTMKERGRTVFSQKKLCVRIKDHQNSPHVKFHRFLFPFSSKFSDLNFASYVLYNLPVLCHMPHTVSLGYLCFNVSTTIRRISVNILRP